ncbi:F0F1 ATP synthase subunit epsilon [Actibacterium sp. 188UL27-1]|uniref:F0F1 ATP synthase subunit epsilon n=1 Tax=Actibacterium sp. 188UL27-1 TaxID=2786961 RepID=UPI0019568573|nr:F0F1 ATP synthase subunit epsilon [Actibacterium sp. 188UL27-1]MBM7066094.1 F0F1 ATP synthase subunit epsilon [Actibacterium sp. 188UL27-1]
MADTMQFDLVSPERSLASLQATEVQIPGSDGDMTAMPDHAPLITTLRPGILTVTAPEGASRYAVTGGFAEITASGTSVLAEMAMPADDVTQDILDTMVRNAADARDNAAVEQKDDMAKQLADIGALATELGMSVTLP